MYVKGGNDLKSQLPFVSDLTTSEKLPKTASLSFFIITAILLFCALALTFYQLIGLKNTIIFSTLLLLAIGITTLVTLNRSRWVIDKPDYGSQSLLNELISLNQRATALTDFAGTLLVYNDVFAEQFGKNIDCLKDIVPDGADTSELKNQIDLIRRTGESKQIFPFVDRSDLQISLFGRRVGSYVLWEVSGSGVEARLQKEIDTLERRSKEILPIIELGLAVEDQQGQLRYINSVLSGWLGLGEDDPLPTELKLEDNATRLVMPDGTYLEIDVVETPITSRQSKHAVGNIKYIRNLALIHSIRQQDNAKILIDPILDAAPMSIAIVEKNGRLLEFNRTFERKIQKINRIHSVSIFDLIHKNNAVPLQALINRAYEEKPFSPPLDVQFLGRGQRLGQVYVSTIHSGEQRYAILFVLDVTQEKRLEQQFVQAQKMQAVGQLAGGVAHDFNNLLTAIIGFCDLLLQRHDTGDQAYSDLIQIKQNANRAANLVRQLLAFSRQQTMRLSVLNLTDILADTTNLLKRLIGDQVILNVTHARDLPLVNVDQGQMEQVIINLAVNARDAMKDGGRLDIRTRVIEPDDPVFEKYEVMTPAKYVLLEVEDTGIGIEPDLQQKIFEPFFTTKEIGEGTGLGLATVYGIVKQTDGFVFCQSDPGKGTIFQVFIRAVDQENDDTLFKAEDELIEADDLTGSGKIILVEDEDPIRLFASRALKSKGYTVLEAANGENALELFRQEDYKVSLLITDVVMPEMDGQTLVIEVRKTLPDLPVIFISGYAENILRTEVQNLENHFLAKPFSLKELAETVKMVLIKAGKENK